MTVHECCAKLYSWFTLKDSFCMEENFMELIPLTETPEKDRATVSIALEEFKKLELVSSAKYLEKTYYVLVKPFLALNQTLTLSGPLVDLVSSTINDFCEATKDKEHLCNPLSISEKDISFLIYILYQNFERKK